MAAKIKKGDEVEIIAGKDRGQRGKVLAVNPTRRRVIVEGLNMVKKHRKAAQNQEAGIIEREASLHMSNVMVIDPNENTPCRVGIESRDGKRVRISKKSGALLD